MSNTTRSRGSTTKRGYGHRHQQTRRAYERQVLAGDVRCARCGETISPDDKWDLGHDDHYRGYYAGAEHASCNRGAPHRNVTSRVW